MRSLLCWLSITLLYIVIGDVSLMGRDACAGRRPAGAHATGVLFLAFVEGIRVPHVNNYRNTQGILFVSCKPTAFNNYGRVNANGVTTRTDRAAEKLGLLPVAINPDNYPVQSQCHACGIADKEVYEQWSLCDPFGNMSLHVIDTSLYVHNVNPLPQLNLLQPDTFFS